MGLEAVELLRLRLPLLSPFRTAQGSTEEKVAVLVRVVTSAAEGWGECAAPLEPTYTAEFAEGAELVLWRHLVPRLLARRPGPAQAVAAALADVQGHPMAKAALEMAVLDAELRAAGQSLAARLGGLDDSVEAGVAVGLQPTVGQLVEAVEGYVAQGYRRVKLKIRPGWDVEPVGAVRRAVGDEISLSVDANGSYAGAGTDSLVALDRFGLTLIEQPLDRRDLAGHARLAATLATPVCLDESIASAAEARAALAAGACGAVNVKAGRVGGYLEAVRIHDLCTAQGTPLRCGGMLDTGLGRAANLALASLPGFTLPGDLSASDRYFAEDVTEPLVLEGGRLAVPAGPGLGVAPRPDALARYATPVATLR